MKNTCNKYTSEDVSRFIDNELPLEQYHALEKHLVHCQDCGGLVEQYKNISDVFTGFTDKEISKINLGELEQTLEQQLQNSEKKSLGIFFGFFGKNFYLKLASITAILMISLFAFQGGGMFSSSAGPSAIVKSVDTDFASVMIIETQKEKHTIIWFSET